MAWLKDEASEPSLSSTDDGYMDLSEFADLGYLQEVNRLFFHPLGLALTFDRHDDGTSTFVGFKDARGDAEGFIFTKWDHDTPGHTLDDAIRKEEFVRAEALRLSLGRERLLGGAIQHVGQDAPS